MNTKTGKTESEIKGTRNFYANIENKLLEEKKENNILEHGNYIAVCSPRNIGGNSACVIFLKDKKTILEDSGILKLLASQALFLFSCQKSAKT
jgi:hypothetical protein